MHRALVAVVLLLSACNLQPRQPRGASVTVRLPPPAPAPGFDIDIAAPKR